MLPAICLSPAIVACSSGTSDDATSAFSASLGEGDFGEDESSESDSESSSDSTESTTTESTTTESTTETSESTTETDTTETGDPDPCPLICDGMPDPTPTSCDSPYVIGRSSAKQEFFFGGNTTGSMDSDNGVCGPVDNPDNWDSGHDHFFRIYLYPDDQIDVTMTGSFDKRVKVHDEEDCVGNAKDCSDGVLSYTALAEGWFTIVADGQSVAFMDWGDYTLRVTLTLGGPDACNCL
ncbi:hypothetical protein ACNOYE_01440 [Nannocystaceae bacterium ST9]